jgi:hypothetical protein
MRANVNGGWPPKCWWTSCRPTALASRPGEPLILRRVAGCMDSDGNAGCHVKHTGLFLGFGYGRITGFSLRRFGIGLWSQAPLSMQDSNPGL